MPRKAKDDGLDAHDAGVEPPLLGIFVDRLHPAVLSVLAAPKGLDIAVSDTVIYDPADPLPVPVGSLVLAVGVDGERERVALMRRLADEGAAGAVIKHDGEPSPTLATAATETGVALLAAPPALAWGQLYTFLSTVANSETGGRDVAELPLGDLFALANAVAAMVGGATTIEDPQNHVLAYSSLGHRIDPPREATILGRQVPDEWIQQLRDSGVFRRLWHSGDVVRIEDFDAPGYLPRLAVVVRAAGEVLGSIWVVEGDQPLGPEAEDALRSASDIAALHLLRHRTAHDVDRRHRGDALLALLEGRGYGERGRSLLQLAADDEVAVIAFEPVAVEPDGDPAPAAIRAARVADLVAAYSESYRRRAACVAIGGRVYALVPQPPDGAARVAELAEAIVDRATESLRVPTRAGIGSTVGDLDDVPASRREADQVLDALHDRPERVARIEDVRDRVILLLLGQLAAERPDLRSGRIDEMAAQDAERGTSWVSTLRAYFDAFGDMSAAAARVNVHPNTFRYRIRRIREVFGLNLDDPDARLVAELQLRFLDS
jgi:hypothetical protein